MSLRLQAGVRCLLPVRRSILRFFLRCWHASRLQCATTESVKVEGLFKGPHYRVDGSVWLSCM